MNASIKMLLAAAIIIQGLTLKAQTKSAASGVYLTENDYRDHKLSYTLAANDKMQLNEFFEGKNINVINDGKRVILAKANIFGYCLSNQDYRFYNNYAYKIIDTAGFTLYCRQKLVQQSKGYAPALRYFYSVDNKKPVKDLTVANLSASFARMADFRYSLQSSFYNDADLITFDNMVNQYKVKYLYFEHKKIIANNP